MLEEDLVPDALKVDPSYFFPQKSLSLIFSFQTGNWRGKTTSNNPYNECINCQCDKPATTPPACNETTGVCLECRNGTKGDKCDNCSAYVDSNDSSCQKCLSGYWGPFKDGCHC